jgi:Protein of unknown function (DUF4231)
MSQNPPPEQSSSERMRALIDTLDLPDFRKDALRQRWLNQMGWMSRQASKQRFRYLLFRIPVVIGGVAIPALITILLTSGESPRVDWLGVQTGAIRLIAFIISMTVAVFATVEETLKFGDRWRHYRRTAELLKTLGWQYLMLAGAFRRYPTHAAAFVPFTERVEDVLNEDVEGYLSAVSAEGRDPSRHEIVA